MNFHPQAGSPSKVQESGAFVLQIDDLNHLIDSLKRREENIIQLLDYNLKFKGSSNHMDVIHLRGLYNQLEEREKKRIEQEDLIIQKYLDLHLSDDYQKKLIIKMKNKILQLNTSARDKLVQLGIFKQAKQAYLGIAVFEESLGQILNKNPLDVHLFLTRLVENSRKRFAEEVEIEAPPPVIEIKQKSFDATPSSIRTTMNIPKTNMQKSMTPSILTKEEEKLYQKGSDNANQDYIEMDLPSNHESKSERASFIVKSIETRPTFEIKESLKASYDMLGIERGSYTKQTNETNDQETNSQNETITAEQISPVKATPPYRETNLKPEVIGFSLNLNSFAMNNERSSGVGSGFSSRTPYVKKVKITNVKKSVCLEEPNESQQEKKDLDKKEPKPSKEAWLKSYDILKIEYTPLPTATKKETKKLLMEKIYKELLATNTEIKKTIKKYRSCCPKAIPKVRGEEEHTKKKSETLDYESNRSEFTNKPYTTVAPLKFKAQTINPTQRSIFYADSTRDTEHIEMLTENFVNGMNSFCPNTTGSSTAKQNKDALNKKPSSTKFLILPKLNLFPDGQAQNPFPSWPMSSQGSKSLKSNLITDAGNRPRFEKMQKMIDRPMNQLLAETKQTIVEQEKANLYTSIGNQSIGSRVVSSSNKSYPITLFSLETGPNINKQVPF